MTGSGEIGHGLTPGITLGGRLRLYPLVVWTIVIALIAGLAAYYLLPLERSIIIEANTQSVDAALTRDTIWNLGDATLCVPPQKRVRTPAVAAQDADRLCGAEEAERGGVNFTSWRPDTQLLVRRIGLGPLEILVRNASGSTVAIGGDEVPIETNSRLLVPETALAKIGALPLEGMVRIGRPAEEAPQAILLDGRFEWRERLPFSERPELVGSGSLFRGDAIRIVDAQGASSASKGFIAPPEPDKAGFGMTASAGRPEVGLALQLVRFGFASTDIHPQWSDRALADQTTYALVALLTVVVTFMSVAVHVRELTADSPSALPAGAPLTVPADTAPAKTGDAPATDGAIEVEAAGTEQEAKASNEAGASPSEPATPPSGTDAKTAGGTER